MARKACLSCFEQGFMSCYTSTWAFTGEHEEPGQPCQAYLAQVAFNRKMRRVFATDIRVVDPPPDWTHVTRMLRETALRIPSESNQFMRAFWAALASPVAEQFTRAIQRAEARQGG